MSNEVSVTTVNHEGAVCLCDQPPVKTSVLKLKEVFLAEKTYVATVHCWGSKDIMCNSAGRVLWEASAWLHQPAPNASFPFTDLALYLFAVIILAVSITISEAYECRKSQNWGWS